MVSKCVCIILCSANKHMSYILLSSCYVWRNWGKAWLSDLPRIPLGMNSKVWMWAQGASYRDVSINKDHEKQSRMLSQSWAVGGSQPGFLALLEFERHSVLPVSILSVNLLWSSKSSEESWLYSLDQSVSPDWVKPVSWDSICASRLRRNLWD